MKGVLYTLRKETRAQPFASFAAIRAGDKGQAA